MCYAHEDKAMVYPQIAWLQDQGVNVWYDEGISAGQNWRAVIGDSLDRASQFLFFISRRSLSSEHCNREINLALDEGKAVVPVYLEAAPLTADLKVGLNRVQALTCDASERYRTKLLNALSPCQGGPPTDGGPIGFGASYWLRRPGRLSWAALLIALAALGIGYAVYLATPETGRSDAMDIPILPNSVAVLPFDNASNDPGDAYLSSGLSDELRDQLNRLPELRIAARSSSIAVGKLGGDARLNSVRLGVTYLVEGRLRRQGSVLRGSVQLIDGASGLVVWSESFTRNPDELLGLQQEIAQNLVRRILPEAVVELPAPATGNASANEALYRGRYYEQQVRASAIVDYVLLRRAIEHYRDAVALDPGSALANSRLAGALVFLGDLDAAEAPIFRALSIDPNLSEVQHTLGLYYFARGRPEAYTAFERAVALDPDNPDALESYAHALWLQPRNLGITNLYRRALEIDRQSLARYGALGEMLALQGETQEVLELVRHVEQRFESEGVDAYRLISKLLQLIGEIDTAIVWAIRARDLEPGNEDHVGQLAELYIEMGDVETALELVPSPGIGLLFKLRRYAELIDAAEELIITEPDDVSVRYLLAEAYNATGDYESAVWVLISTGLPETVMTFPRSVWDWRSFFSLINATYGLGDEDMVRGLAEWFIDRPYHHDNPDWFKETMAACAFSVLDRDEEAFDELEEIQHSPRLPSTPFLKDAPCLRKYAGSPRFEAVVEIIDARRARLRERLPETLSAFGVSL
ncbi:MAG TPA: tetratricopeptide repeat protein [Pseudomonadales bacterium]